MGDKKTTTTGQSRLSWPIRSRGIEALQGAQDLYRDPATQELPSGYVPMSQERRGGLEEMYATANQPGGSMVPREALAEWQKTVGGEYLHPDSNPYLQEVVGRSVGAAGRAVRSGFGGAGRYGSGAFANSAMDAASETASRLYGENYGRERQMMLSYMGMAPSMNKMQYADPSMRGLVGSQYEADQLASQKEETRQFMWPYQRQQIYEASIAGSPLTAESNTEQTTSQPFDWMAMVSGMMNPLGGIIKSVVPGGGAGG
jgi:hypothetical protein